MTYSSFLLLPGNNATIFFSFCMLSWFLICSVNVVGSRFAVKINICETADGNLAFPAKRCMPLNRLLCAVSTSTSKFLSLSNKGKTVLEKSSSFFTMTTS